MEVRPYPVVCQNQLCWPKHKFGHIFPQCLTRSCHIGSLIRLGVFTIRRGKQLWHKTKAFVSQRSNFLDIGQLAPGPWEQRHLPTSKEDTSPLPGTRWVVFGECAASCSKPTVVPVSYISYPVLDSLLQQTDYSLQGDSASQLTWEARSLACAVPLDFGYW